MRLYVCTDLGVGRGKKENPSKGMVAFLFGLFIPEEEC